MIRLSADLEGLEKVAWSSFCSEISKLAMAPVPQSIEIPRAVPELNRVSTKAAPTGTVTSKPGRTPRPGRVNATPAAGPAGLNASGQGTPPPAVRS